MSELRKNDQFEENTSEKPQLCHTCFQFFGQKANDWLCSKCHKVKSKTEDSKPNSPLTSSLLSRSSTMDIEPPICNITTFEEAKIEQVQIETIKVEEKKVVQSEPNKCFKCVKKVGLLGFQCSCELTFCKFHRLPEDHDCSYDFTRVAKERLMKDNPVVKASKIDRF